MGRHYFRLSLTRECGPLSQFNTLYHGLGLEAHILELYSNAVGTFLAKVKKPYFIDPILYRLFDPLFLDVKEKRWVAEVVERYGLVEAIAENDDGLTNELFSASGTAPAGVARVDPDVLVSRVLDYERGRVPEVGAGQSLWDQLEGGKPLLDASDFASPEFLVAPYIQISDTPSLELNARLAASAVKQKHSGEQVAAVVPIPSDYLSKKDPWKDIVSHYGPLGLDSLMLWIGDFREWEEEPALLEAFARFIANIKSAIPTIQLTNLYGSFFSTVLAGRGLLDGTVQGVGISEHKDPYATGGGGVSRYYIPISRRSVSTDLATDMQQLNSDLFSCPCQECTRGTKPSQMAAAALAQHFILTRSKELKWATDTSLADIIQQLTDAATNLSAVKGAIGGVSGAHGRRLMVWATVLEGLASSGVLK